MRAALCAGRAALRGACLADYKWSLRNLCGEEYEQAKRKCHARGADRLQKLCFANRGVYVKLGQHIAQLVGCHLLRNTTVPMCGHVHLFTWFHAMCCHACTFTTSKRDAVGRMACSVVHYLEARIITCKQCSPAQKSEVQHLLAGGAAEVGLLE